MMFGRKYTNPQAGLSTDQEGPDPDKMRMLQAPKVDSLETAAEAVELYWMALLRDVTFTQFDTAPAVATAAAELAGLTEFTGKVNNTVTPQTIFRGCESGDLVGPYLSQFLLKDVPYGALIIPQKIRTVLGESVLGAGNADFLTNFQDWLDVQNGKSAFPMDTYDATRRYIRNMRDLGEYVHVDALYEAYLNACLILLDMMAPVDGGNPYKAPNTASRNQIGFGTFGGPHILSLVTEVATRALKVVWYQKWQVHRRLRPEAYGGLVHLKKAGTQPLYPIPAQVLNSQAVAQTHTKFGSYLLPMAFREGSPTHPSYGAGHATVAGACVTVLKAFFDENAPMPNPVVPTPDGSTLVPYTGPDAGNLTVGGELNKVAANIAIGRNMAGVHWRSDYYQSLRLGERVAICILYNQRKDYHEDYSFTFTSFDGQAVTITRNGVSGLNDFTPCKDKK
jgi:membrane-associated phospholipid phosphatase